MLELEELKKSMTPEQYSKVELAMSRLKTLTPDARSQIIMGIDAMVECEVTKKNLETLKREVNRNANQVQTSTTNFDLNYDLEKLKYLESELNKKYVELKEVSACIHDISNKDSVCKAVERVLKLGTYSQGASAVMLSADIASLWLQIDLLKYHIKNYHKYDVK